ncbi:MAG: hypothetical protein EON52_00465 [Actinomycetales bacterium]|nr:MAG: hypothetical protein EON52_00465 [Actinomycetales bacterium]
MKTAVPALVATLLLLSGCSGGGSTAAPEASGSASPSLDVPVEGQPAPDALRSFQCRADAEGDWNAEGRIANPAKTAHSYSVTAQVGPADGEQVTAKRVKVTVPARSTESFLLPKLPTSSPDGPCHLRVVVTD